ncbi:Galacturonokinase [Acorus calamus]|uniref:Galacturonokinase n=1 Tax=Acorus calamus TaxID=4465 RepID=A0AAV9FFZ4_ACOCL|nr:Galacturonokinase [Acorus calamus]
MGATLMALTSVLLSAAIAAMISSKYTVKNPIFIDNTTITTYGAHGDFTLSLKYVTLLLVFLFAFACHALSIRFINRFNHLIIFINTHSADSSAIVECMADLLERGFAFNIHRVRKGVAEMSGVDAGEVRVVVSPYRICPLGAHIDHQGGTVAAMTINKGILLGFVPSGDGQGIIGFICGSDDLDSSGLSSSAAVGISYLLALESANKLTMTPTENIELDRVIENEYLGVRNGILDQSAILLSSHGCLTRMNCKGILQPDQARRAEHYFSENRRVIEGLNAWASGDLQEFGRLISASGLSSIQNYECGCEPLIQLYEVLMKAPGVLGARFSGAGFRGCCIAFVDADLVTDATTFVKHEYQKLQPKLSSQLKNGMAVLICEAGDSAHII